MKDPQSSTELTPDDSGAIPITSQDSKTRKTFSRIKVELSDEELASPGVQKMIVEELGRSQDMLSSMESYRDRYHQADKQLAIQLEKSKKNISTEIISGGCLATGAAAFGYAPSLTSLPLAGWLAVGFGIILTIIGIASKAIVLK